MIDVDPDKVDKKLAGWGIVIKKHWKLILLLAFGYCIYWFAGQVAEEVENPTEPEYINESYNDTYPEEDTAYYEEYIR